jgi:site-specific recombinase XerC
MKLKPTKCAVRGEVRWLVRVGKRFSGGTEPKRHYFDSRAEANEFIAGLEGLRRRLGQAAFTLTLAQQAEAALAFSRLTPLGVQLAEVVDYYIKRHPNGHTAPLLKVFAEEAMRARAKSCKPRTLATYKSDLKHINRAFGSVRINEIYQADVEEWAADLDLAPRTIGNVLDTFTTILNDAIRKDLLTRNPAAFVPRPAVDPAPPGILTPHQAACLLVQAMNERPSLVRAIAIALFAGLRRAELCRIDHTSLLLDESLIDVPARAAKTRQRRLVAISGNLAEWVKATPATIGSIAGTTNPDVFGDWLRQIAVAGDVQPWPHNATRHSFGSYLFAKTRNECHVSAEMGNTPNIVIRHYRAVVRPAAAQAYFDIRPANVAVLVKQLKKPTQ